MFPSSTVENYIKVIHAQQVRLSDPDGLVPMGHLAMGMGVTPGTATTMVKALADSGLVHYAPYAGVRLTRAGERLAGRVIRRHRLIELFLVQVMGLRWDEVHDDAEQLEHVVSERLIERMDEMLGHPEVDPHGDPIPDAHGTFHQRELHTLLTCPLHVPVTVMRVADQDASFLRFVESHHLKPGQQLSVDARDEVADSVSVQASGGQPLTIGARAASKLLVEVVAIVLMVLGLANGASAQTSSAPAPPPDRTDSSRPFEIEDNSFFVEEAFNQEPGVVQTIFGGAFMQDSGWGIAFTQEWPAPNLRHQLSFTIPFSGVDGHGGIGDIALNYRYQLLEEGAGRPAMAPRLSLLVPSGDQSRGLGSGWGLQVNLPVSKQVRDFYFHGNAGFTWRPSADTDMFPSANLVAARDVTLFSPFIGGSAIYRLRPMVNLMLESVLAWEDDVVAPSRSERSFGTLLSPGVRTGWNRGKNQIIIGAALPITRANDATDVGLFTYFSFEGPLWKAK